MKTHHLIILTTALFIVLFYGESMGINFAILGFVYALLTLYKTPEKNKTRTFLILFVTSIFSSAAFAWFGDFISFVAVVSSLFLLDLKSKSKNLKTLFIIPLFIVNGATFICRVFNFPQWIPLKKSGGSLQKMISIFVIPGIFILLFFAVYTYGSDHFANFFSDFELNINFIELIALTFLGFVIAFNFWNFYVERIFYKNNSYLNNEFENENIEHKLMFGFLDVDAQRISGVVTFMALNVLLIFFIFTYNYEQFYEIPKSPNQLSAETHDRVNSVIFSIVMAIAVILMYFRGGFNFDKNAKLLKISAKIWIVLNAVLVFSAMAKNTEYITGFGLTYKRLGVYAFLILSVIGLMITFYKIQKQKTNAFLFNQMMWYFYGTILVCSFINWGGIATNFNIKNKKGNVDFLKTLHFNHSIIKEHFPNEEKNLNDYNERNGEYGTYISKILYYETIK